MLTNQELDHIANLARIKIKDAERDSLKKDLSSILDYVAKLDEAKTDGVEPLYQTAGIVNATRDDEADRLLCGQGEKLVKAAPQKEGRFVKVKKVFNR